MTKQLLGTFILSVAIIGQASGQTLSWSAPETVAMGSMYSNIYPRLTLNAAGDPVVIWGSGSNDKIYSAKWNGSAFDTPLTLNPDGLIPFVANWAGAEIASAGDTVFVTFSTDLSLEGKVYTVRSLNGGLSFEDTVRVDQIGTDVPRFPTITVANGGNPVVAFMQLDENFENAEYAVARSMNGGTSYMPSIIPSLAAVGSACDCCPASIVADGNTHILTYRNDNNNIRNMWASYSFDGSTSYSASSEIDQTNWMIMSCPSSGPSNIIIGDSLISTWMSDGAVYFGTSNINDQQNGLQRELFPVSVGTQNFPVIAGKGDTLGIVWQAYNGPQEVFFSWSFTGAAGLGYLVDTLTAEFSGSQTRPDLEYADGKFHLVYSDGQNVKYRNAILVNPAALSENTASEFNFTVNQSNGLIEVGIQSESETEITMSLLNSIGQELTEKRLDLHQGSTSCTLTNPQSKGLYYLVLKAKNGTVKTQRVILTP
jgi:hypothetical protein